MMWLLIMRSVTPQIQVTLYGLTSPTTPNAHSWPLPPIYIDNRTKPWFVRTAYQLSVSGRFWIHTTKMNDHEDSMWRFICLFFKSWLYNNHWLYKNISDHSYFSECFTSNFKCARWKEKKTMQLFSHLESVSRKHFRARLYGRTTCYKRTSVI